MSKCSKTTDEKHEWQSGVAATISCIHCGEIWDQFGKIPPDELEKPNHAEGCICNLCMSEEEYQNHIQSTKTSDIPEWIIRCPECKCGLDWIIEYPIKTKEKDETEQEIETEDYTVAYCSACKKEFDPFWDVDKNEELDIKSISTGMYSYSSAPVIHPPVQYNNIQYKSCKHEPQHVISGENWNVFAGKRNDVEKLANEFDIVLNLTGYHMDKEHTIPFQELSKWRKKQNVKYKEICLNWPDMGVVDLPKEFWLDLIGLFKKKKSKVLMFCAGGHGRTGTAMAVFMVLGLGWKPTEAIEWIRKNYCDKAIETWNQKNYIYNMIGENAPPSIERKDKICTDTCVCQSCMTDAEYLEYKNSGHKIYPESYLKRKAELKEKKEKPKEQETHQEKADQQYFAAWGQDVYD